VSISPISSPSISALQNDTTPPSQASQTRQSGDASSTQAPSPHKSHSHHHRGDAKTAAAPAVTTPSDPKAPGANLNFTT
jgi:hypothetical protein